LKAQAGANVVWVNGGIVLSPGADVAGAGGTINGVDVLKMKRVLRREKEWIRALEALGLSRQEAVKVVSDSGGGASEEGKAKTSQVSREIMDGRVDASDRQEGGDVILWWNDIEKDAKYARWSASFYSVSLHLCFAS
jgi:UDP-glucose:glycoprotein glucosyltransferase